MKTGIRLLLVLLVLALSLSGTALASPQKHDSGISGIAYLAPDNGTADPSADPGKGQGGSNGQAGQEQPTQEPSQEPEKSDPATAATVQGGGLFTDTNVMLQMALILACVVLLAVVALFVFSVLRKFDALAMRLKNIDESVDFMKNRWAASGYPGNTDHPANPAVHPARDPAVMTGDTDDIHRRLSRFEREPRTPDSGLFSRSRQSDYETKLPIHSDPNPPTVTPQPPAPPKDEMAEMLAAHNECIKMNSRTKWETALNGYNLKYVLLSTRDGAPYILLPGERNAVFAAVEVPGYPGRAAIIPSFSCNDVKDEEVRKLFELRPGMGGDSAYRVVKPAMADVVQGGQFSVREANRGVIECR